LLPLLERHAGGLAVGVEAVLFEVQAAVAAQACFGQAGVDGVAASDGVVRCAMAASVPDVAPRVPEGLGDPEVPRAEASAGKPRRGIHGAACVHARARSRSELGANADGDGVHVELVVVGPGAAEVGTQFELHTLDDAVVDAAAVVVSLLSPLPKALDTDDSVLSLVAPRRNDSPQSSFSCGR